VDSFFKGQAAFLKTPTERLQDPSHNSYAQLVFNLDEMRISEWEDHTERQILVQSTMRRQAIFHPIHWILQHVLLVSCISTIGERAT
jgi:hypothetical protein